MKKTFTLSILLLFLIGSNAQSITMTSANMPLAGWTQQVAKDTLPLPAINFGSPGANQVYNFSNLVPVFNNTVLYKALTAQQQSVFTGADVAITTDNQSYLYTKTTASVFDIRGLEGKFVPSGNVIQAPYQTPADIFHFPTTYGTTFSGSSALVKIVDGSDVDQPVDQVRYTTNSTYTDEVDGWGTITTPVGTYNCLRKKRTETVYTLVEYKTFSFSSWSVAPGFPTTVTTTRYSYPTIETKGSVVTFDYDANTPTTVTGVTWSLIPPPAPVANFGYTSGGGGLILFVDSTNGYPDTYSWNFGDGSPNATIQHPNHTYTANGAYYVCLTVTNAGGSDTYCDSVYVTGLGSANNPPLAITDTVSLLQGTTITIFHVAANDIDPDLGDNLCMDAVWGSPFVTEYIGGSCDMVTIAPDSTFVGTDTAWYRICDDGTPVLCDTGMIIFTVNADPALLPVASISNWIPTSCNTLTAIQNSQNYSGTPTWYFDNFLNGHLDTLQADTAYLFYTSHGFWGSVCVTVSNQFGTSTDCDTINFICEDIHDIALTNVSFFPNPATSHLTIDMSNNNDEITRDYTGIEIYNAIGEKVMLVGRQTSREKVVNIPVSELPEGMYVATIIDSQGTRRTLGRFTKE